MPIRFEHLGAEWDATPTGMGHGVGTKADRWGFVFRRVGQPATEYRAHVSAPSAESVTLPALIDALDEAMVRQTIEGSRYIYRTAEAISRDTTIDLQRVRRILETADDFIEGARPNAQGLTLYSTREHYRKNAGFVKRYLDTLESS